MGDAGCKLCNCGDALCLNRLFVILAILGDVVENQCRKQLVFTLFVRRLWRWQEIK